MIRNGTKIISSTSGFSLVEVLVALIILMIGLLGLAALQITGLKFNNQSYQRTQATIQSYSIIDRIRANRDATGTINVKYDLVGAGSTPGSTDCAASVCSPDDMADYDIRTWNQANANLLPQGLGTITKNGVNYTITITWDEKGTTQSLVMETQL